MDDLMRFDLRRYKHWIDDRVRFSDLDPLGHVNNNSVGQYFENARAAFYIEFTPKWPYGDALFVLAHTSIDFRKELHYPAALRIGTGIMKIGRTSITVVNGLFRDNEGIAYCESVSVLINHKTRQPHEISDELRSKISVYTAS